MNRIIGPTKAQLDHQRETLKLREQLDAKHRSMPPAPRPTPRGTGVTELPPLTEGEAPLPIPESLRLSIDDPNYRAARARDKTSGAVARFQRDLAKYEERALRIARSTPPTPAAVPAPTAPPAPSVAEREAQLAAEEAPLVASYNASRERLLQIQREKHALRKDGQ